MNAWFSLRSVRTWLVAGAAAGALLVCLPGTASAGDYGRGYQHHHGSPYRYGTSHRIQPNPYGYGYPAPYVQPAVPYGVHQPGISIQFGTGGHGSGHGSGHGYGHGSGHGYGHGW